MCLHIVFKKKLYIFKKSSILASKWNFERSLLSEENSFEHIEHQDTCASTRWQGDDPREYDVA